MPLPPNPMPPNPMPPAPNRTPLRHDRRGLHLLVCGGRRYGEQEGEALRLFRELDLIHQLSVIDLVIHGGASGADRLAEKWALGNGVPCLRVPARWRRHGPAAGPIRNREMLTYLRVDWVLAAPGGTGTADMVRQANEAGVPTVSLGNEAPPTPR